MNKYKVRVWAAVMGCTALLAADAQHGKDSFDAFIKRDRESFERFRTGKVSDKRASAKAQRAQAISPKQQRAQAIYDEYCRLRGALDDQDPSRGLNARIAALRRKLFPTNRPWVDSLSLWGGKEWREEWPLLQDLEARAISLREAVDKLEDAWLEEGFANLFYIGLDSCYGRKAWYVYHDTADQSVFPSPIRSNQMDYVSYQMLYIWPPQAPTATTSAPRKPEAIVHDSPPPPVQPPLEIPRIDETIREENVEVVKPWEAMTPEERRRALMENRPEAWSGFTRDVFGTDTNGHALAKTVVAHSNVTDVATTVALANLPPPTPVTTGKTWDAMTAEERYVALKANEPLAWDGLRDAMLSGMDERIQQVLEALSARPQIPDVARATAYWHGYQTAQMEVSISSEHSVIETVAAAYVHPELMALVRQGYADAQAGVPPQYTLPGGDALQSLTPTP